MLSGSPSSLHGMKMLWWEQDLCSLSACNPSTMDRSALAHPLFLLRSHWWASVCSVCFVCVGACVFKCHWAVWNGEGEHRFALGGGGCTVKKEQRFSSSVFTFHCSRPLGRPLGGGRSEKKNRGNVFITPAAGKSKHQLWVILARPCSQRVTQQSCEGAGR